MKRNKTIRKIFFQILKNTILGKAFIGYIVFFLVSALLLTLLEPSIITYGDGLWYAFVSSSTTGFGDMVAVGTLGRILTVLLYIYTVFILALVTAVFTQFFFEIAKAKRNNSVAILQHDLEHLEDLPKERLKEISEKIRKFRDK